MSDNFGIIGDTVTNERWIDDVNKGVDFDQDGKVDMVGYDQTLNVFNPDSEIRKYPAYYIGSAIGEVPYFLSPAIAIRGPVQTAKILASATRIAGKASLSMKNINVTSKMGNAGKNIVKSVQKEQKNIGTDAPVNTKAANEGMDLLEKNIDNQIQVKENLSIRMSKEGKLMMLVLGTSRWCNEALKIKLQLHTRLTTKTSYESMRQYQNYIE